MRGVKGTCWDGYTIVTVNETTESFHLSPSIHAQSAELVALKRALDLRKDKMVNIYANSQYICPVLNALVVTWKGSHFLTANVSPNKYHQEIDKLLSLVFPSWGVTVILCKGHQKGAEEPAE